MAGVEISAESGAGFELRLRHGPSGSLVVTQPPADNGGTGAAFSPTDLAAASLLSCVITTMALGAKREGLPWGPASGRVEKIMSAAPRRIAELPIEIRMPAGLSAAQRARLEEVGRGCPIARSLHPDVRAPMTFVYPD